MSTVQLSFSLRVSRGVKTVHLVGTWDNYQGKLPLSLDKSSSKPGKWRGTFNFKNNTLKPGKRYWYYYIIDGCQVAHNPSVDHTVEPTTSQKLNILDIPKSSSSKSSSSKSSSSKSSSKSSSSKSKDDKSRKSSDRRSSRVEIKAPVPISHAATHTILSSKFEKELESLQTEFGSIQLDGYDKYDTEEIITNFDFDQSSGITSSISSLSGSSSPASNFSGYSTPDSACSSCSCERYGITRSGERVRIDCNGSRCGYDCCDSEEDGECYSDEEECAAAPSPYYRNGLVVSYA